MRTTTGVGDGKRNDRTRQGIGGGFRTWRLLDAGVAASVSLWELFRAPPVGVEEEEKEKKRERMSV